MKILEIELPTESDVSNFQQLIQFLYTTSISVDESEIQSLLELSDRFTVTPLKEACSHSLGNNINDGNILNLLQIVSKFQVSELRRKIVDYIAKHFKYVFSFIYLTL